MIYNKFLRNLHVADANLEIQLHTNNIINPNLHIGRANLENIIPNFHSGRANFDAPNKYK